jgi:hypothetical protein
VERYVHQVCWAIFTSLRKKFLRPPTAEEAALVNERFADRRGLGDVGLALDGTHVPWQPEDKAWKQEFHNYKGWYSVLCVFVVNSYYMFVSGEVGHPGRSGDSTVTKNSWFMEEIRKDPVKWLGKENGLIVSDGGLGMDDLIITPYPLEGLTQKQRYFNFCLSSTRIYVEQVFGMWKMRWRVLMRETEVKRSRLNFIIWATVILHNICCVYGLTFVPTAEDVEEVLRFMKQYAHTRCKDCVSNNRIHCVHRVRTTRARTAVGSQLSMLERRDKLCDQLWHEYFLKHGRYPVMSTTFSKVS